MSVLDRKILRDLLRMWPQALAVALVLASGIATLILAVGAHRSLDETRRAYYERYRFADVFSTLRRAPLQLIEQIREIDGISAAEARVMQYGILDIPGMTVPATGFALSLPDQGEPLLNRVYLRKGRFPEPGRPDEVTVDEPFAKAHGFELGARFEAVMNGRKLRLVIVGIGLSPEYIYALGPGDLMPDPRRFGVLWMSQRALSGIFDLNGAFNSVSVKLTPGTNPDEIIDRVDELLARYGGAGAYARKDHLSHAFLDAELKQLEALSRVIPPIFLFVAAFLVNMTLGRLVALEREQIGLLKAVGYGPGAIAMHYLKLVAAIAMLGVVLGMIVGTWLGVGLTQLYGRFFNFPFLIFQRDLDIYLLSGSVALGAALVGALRSTLSAARLAPAVAMQPPAPPRFRRGALEKVLAHFTISQMTMISLRGLIRWPVRAAFTTLGAALAVALLVTSLFAVDSIEFMVDTTFYRSDRQQATVNFVEPRPANSLESVSHMPGVLVAEPQRSVAARIRHGHLERKVAILGKTKYPRLSRVLNDRMQPVAIPEHGLLINERLAEVLGAGRGREIEISILEGRRQTRRVVVSDVIKSYFGLIAVMNIDALNDMLDDPDLISAVHVSYDPLQERALFDVIKTTPAIASIALQKIALRRFRETLAENINIMTSVYIALSVVIIFGVVYNSARVQLSERARELASLRVLGFRRTEVSRVLLVELFILVVIAQPLGWLLGYAFSWLTIQGFSSDLYTTPLIIERATYAKATIVALVAAAFSALVVRRRVDHLDLIAVLKTRD